MMKYAPLLTLIALTACADDGQPVVTSVNTMCISTTRYHATDAQVSAFKADQTTWESLVNWLAGFNKVRDAECLKPVPGP